MDMEIEPMEIIDCKVEVDGIEIELNCEQEQVLDCTMEKVKYMENNSFFLLIGGAAGTGKSLLLKILRDQICQLHGENSCLVTAPTAASAEKLNARTIDSTFLFMNYDPFEPLPKEQKKALHSIWKKCKVLMIDDINYVNSTVFARIDHRSQDVLNTKQPFGGLSVIVFGDLLQLGPEERAPVIYRDIERCYREPRDLTTPDSPKILWSLFELFELQDNMRMRFNPEEAQILEKIRSSDNVAYVQKKLLEVCKLGEDSEIGIGDVMKELKTLREAHPQKKFVILVPDEHMVEQVNQVLTQVGPVGDFSPQEVTVKQTNTVLVDGAEEEDDLKVTKGSQVVLTCNIEEYNVHAGTLGTVMDFEKDTITVEFPCGTVDLERVSLDRSNWKQFPIRLAEVLTIRESQGMEFDGVIIVAKESWFTCDMTMLEPGHMYTALSRAKSLELCRITPLDCFGWKTSKSALTEWERLQNREEMDSNNEMNIVQTYLSEKVDREY
ncbi:hypothetical protein GCK72_025933 [Caenorhabditis remanei]|uniref:ATP-dependent DNA helicase n=1 Tax=Caenorhabditis remanei TaxID=31234 RepID=A0A6A5G430_CAERE|nr:hypothetical protein GCK72_025933 [Caenorhabditis remanei]KAF1749465.1 hypothetical protein GCK72_025933 [Caenorhabditis remanei]